MFAFWVLLKQIWSFIVAIPYYSAEFCDTMQCDTVEYTNKQTWIWFLAPVPNSGVT